MQHKDMYVSCRLLLREIDYFQLIKIGHDVAMGYHGMAPAPAAAKEQVTCLCIDAWDRCMMSTWIRDGMACVL
jgi:hypothetical protein